MTFKAAGCTMNVHRSHRESPLMIVLLSWRHVDTLHGYNGMEVNSVSKRHPSELRDSMTDFCILIWPFIGGLLWTI